MSIKNNLAFRCPPKRRHSSGISARAAVRKHFSRQWILPVFLLIFPALFMCSSAEAAPFSFTDDSGRQITLPRPATRIIPLYAAFSEILLELGQEKRLIARTASDRNVPGLPSVGTHLRQNLELVYGLEPDLVLQMQGRGESIQTAEALRSLGVRVAVFNLRNFEDLFRVIALLGQASDAQEEARALAESLRHDLEELQRKLARIQEKPTVFFELRYPGLIAAGPDSITDAIITAAGGQNCLNSLYNKTASGILPNRSILRLSEEILLTLDPEVYLIQRGPMNKNPRPLPERPHFLSLRACKNNRFLVVDEEMFSRPGPKNIRAARLLAEFLHPDCFIPDPDYSDSR
jgi:iron complex transport system substrate-binding protein